MWYPFPVVDFCIYHLCLYLCMCFEFCVLFDLLAVRMSENTTRSCKDRNTSWPDPHPFVEVSVAVEHMIVICKPVYKALEQGYK